MGYTTVRMEGSKEPPHEPIWLSCNGAPDGRQCDLAPIPHSPWDPGIPHMGYPRDPILANDIGDPDGRQCDLAPNSYSPASPYGVPGNPV